MGKVNEGKKFDTIVERVMVQKIQYPNRITFSTELRDKFAREYIKIRSETNSKPSTILKALRFLIEDAESDYREFLNTLKTTK